MTYLRPALSKVRFRRALESGLPPGGIGSELARLATAGGCSPADLASFLDEIGTPDSPWAASVPALRRSIADAVERQIARTGWKSLGGACPEPGQMLARETSALKEVGRNRDATARDAFMLALRGADTLEPIPNALSLSQNLSLSPEEKLTFKRRVLELLTDGSTPLPQTTVAALSKGQLCDGDEFIPARLEGVAISASCSFGEARAADFAARLGSDLRKVKGLHLTQQRLLTQLEAYNCAATNYGAPHDFLALAAGRYQPGETNKGRERETRAFFGVLSEAAHLMRDKHRGDPGATKQLADLASQLDPSNAPERGLREIRSRRLGVLAEKRATRLGTAFALQTGKPARSFATGLRVASPKTVEVAGDLVASARALDTYTAECDTRAPRAAMAEVMGAFAEGRYSEWKYSHALAAHQLAHLSPDQASLWREDHSWQLPFDGPGGTPLRARETSDLRESLYFADRPVSSCASLLSDGANGFTAVSVASDANKKVVFIEDHRGNILGRTLVRTCYATDGEPLVVVETAYSSVGSARFRNQLQAGVVAGLGKKFGGSIEIAAGICMTDHEQVARANDLLGFSDFDEPSELALPASLAGYEYVDSSLMGEAVLVSDPGHPEHEVIRSAVLRNADKAPSLPAVASTVPTPSPWGGEERFFTRTQTKLSEAGRILNKLFPNRDERLAFAAAHPDCLPTGDVPEGSEAVWREVLVSQPEAAKFLHHAAFATALMRGHPSPERKGEDFREAVAIAEAQPLFTGLIGGLDRSEVAGLRVSWHSGIKAQVRSGPPACWPPQVNARSLVPTLSPTASLEVPEEFARRNRGLRQLSNPSPAPEQAPALSP